MQIIRPGKLYVPAITIIAVVLLLIGLIAITTYRTLDHQKKTALAFMKSQGVTLLHALEAGALTGMMLPQWNEDSVKTLIREIGRNRNIAFIYVFDPQGIIVHDSNPGREGTRSSWRPELAHDRQVATRLTRLPEGLQVFELAKRFAPEALMTPAQRQYIASRGSDASIQDHHAGDTVVLGLSMSQYEAAHRADVQHAVLMASILLLLGSGALFFIFVIQNYYVVDRALGQSRDYLKQVIASMANGMVSIDRQAKPTAFNAQALDLLGVDEAQIRRTGLGALIDLRAAGIEEALNGGASFVEREITYQRGADVIPLALTVSPIQDDQKGCTGVVIILRDLSDIKRLQEKVRRTERLAALGELAAGVAHEVRNPLSSVRGFAHYLKHVLQDRPQEREYADIMIKEVDRINNVMTNLLSFARPAEPRPEPTDLPGLLDHTVRLAAEDARLKKVEIRVSASPGLEDVRLDGGQITQVMLNLVLNALQAVEEGGHIAVEAYRTDRGRLRLTVEDDGPGIASDQAAKIFQPFYTTREKGTGLGLAIVHNIVENHGGEIRVVSPLPGGGRGSRMVIDLPIGTGQPASSDAPDAGATPGRQNNRGEPHDSQNSDRGR